MRSARPPRSEDLHAAIAREETRLKRLEAEQTEARSRLAAFREELAALGSTPECHAGLPANRSSAVPRMPSEKVRLFRSLFRGRADVFATRFSPGTVFAYVSLHVMCTAGNVDSAPTTNCSQNFNYTASADVDTLLHLRIPFTAGTQFYLQVSPTLIAGLGLPFIDFSGTADILGHAIGDFSHTAVFEGATVFDAFGSPLPDAVIESVSGFDYRTGFVVPEPGAVALQSVSLVALGFIKWLHAA